MAFNPRCPLAVQNMEPLHRLRPNSRSLSASQETSPTRDFVVLWRNLHFPVSGPEKPAVSQRTCKIRACPWARGNFHARYTKVHGHSREVGIYLVVQACTIFFPSYGLVNAVSNCMYPIRHSQFSGKNGLGCPMGYLGWMHAWVQDCTDHRICAATSWFRRFFGQHQTKSKKNMKTDPRALPCDPLSS